MVNNFLNNVIYQFDLQGQEIDSTHTTGHPDPTIRAFYRSASKLFKSSKKNLYHQLLEDAHIKRPGMDEGYFVNLLFRSVQFSLRQTNNFEYVNYRDGDWDNYFKTVCINHLGDIYNIIVTENTATHIPQRYRSLNAAIRSIFKHHPNFDLRVGDVGCSLGLGLKACLHNGFLKEPPFIDDTPNQEITKLFDIEVIQCSRAVGIDIHLPTVEWVKACNYPSRYSADAANIDNAIISLSTTKFKVDVVESNILNHTSVNTLTGDSNPLNIVYSSMALYELSSDDKKTAMKNICDSLCEGGLFIEFTFIDSKNWFMGINAYIYQKKHNKFSDPLTWLFWHDSRCNHVEPGKDYEKANKLFAKIHTC